MKTEDLVEMLARGDTPPTPPPRRMWLMSLAGGLLAALLLVILFMHMRPDIGVSLPWVLGKAAFAAAGAAIVLPIGLRLLKPGRPLGLQLAAIVAFIALALIVAATALMGEAPEDRMDALMGGGFPWCVVLVPVLAAPTAMLLAWLMRAFAPTRLTLAGAAIGAVSGGIGAMAYAMYCPVDSIAFVTIWYSAAIALSAALGALIVSRFLRW